MHELVENQSLQLVMFRFQVFHLDHISILIKLFISIVFCFRKSTLVHRFSFRFGSKSKTLLLTT